MDDLLKRLKPNQRRGSKLRCHRLTHGPGEEVAARLTALLAPFGIVSATDNWMPQGFDSLEEAELDKAPRLLDPDRGRKLRSWWLAVDTPRSRTPNFDIASTCTIEGKPGLLLVEAKAHDKELIHEEAPKRLAPNASDDSKANHKRIGECIKSASDELRKATSLRWDLSRDSRYQMSNRFAWAWKLTALGRPVILVYLGFLNADEMEEGEDMPFATDGEWESLVRAHSQPLFPPQVWNSRWESAGQPFIPLIRSLNQPLK